MKCVLNLKINFKMYMYVCCVGYAMVSYCLCVLMSMKLGMLGYFHS